MVKIKHQFILTVSLLKLKLADDKTNACLRKYGFLFFDIVRQNANPLFFLFLFFLCVCVCVCVCVCMLFVVFSFCESYEIIF